MVQWMCQSLTYSFSITIPVMLCYSWWPGANNTAIWRRLTPIAVFFLNYFFIRILVSIKGRPLQPVHSLPHCMHRILRSDHQKLLEGGKATSWSAVCSEWFFIQRWLQQGFRLLLLPAGAARPTDRAEPIIWCLPVMLQAEAQLLCVYPGVHTLKRQEGNPHRPRFHISDLEMWTVSRWFFIADRHLFIDCFNFFFFKW